MHRCKQHADKAGDGGRADDVLLLARVAELDHPLQIADEVAGHVLDGRNLVGQRGVPALLVVDRRELAEDGDFRLQLVHAIEGTQDALSDVEEAEKEILPAPVRRKPS